MALVPMFWALKCAGCRQVFDNEKSKCKGQVIFTIIPLNPQYFSQYGLFHQLRRNNESNLFFVFQINHRSTQASGSSLLILWLSIPMAYHPLKLFQNPEGLLSLKKASAILIDQAERENCQALFLFQPLWCLFCWIQVLNIRSLVQASILWPSSCWPRACSACGLAHTCSIGLCPHSRSWPGFLILQ